VEIKMYKNVSVEILKAEDHLSDVDVAGENYGIVWKK
jgi:hypothetical protein